MNYFWNFITRFWVSGGFEVYGKIIVWFVVSEEYGATTDKRFKQVLNVSELHFKVFPAKNMEKSSLSNSSELVTLYLM